MHTMSTLQKTPYNRKSVKKARRYLTVELMLTYKTARRKNESGISKSKQGSNSTTRNQDSQSP